MGANGAKTFFMDVEELSGFRPGMQSGGTEKPRSALGLLPQMDRQAGSGHRLCPYWDRNPPRGLKSGAEAFLQVLSSRLIAYWPISLLRRFSLSFTGVLQSSCKSPPVSPEFGFRAQ